MHLALQGCTCQAALERQDLSCMYVAHHDLKSVLYQFTVMHIADELQLHATAPDEVYYELGNV